MNPKVSMNIEEITRAYMSASTAVLPASLARDFNQFIVELAQQELQTINLQYIDYQPYYRGSRLYLEDMTADFQQGNLKITTQFNQSELLEPDTNLLLRAIHDRHHVKLKVGFDWQGECAAAAHIMSLTENFLFKQILFSEFLAQAAVYFHTKKFINPQKIVLFTPEVWQDLGLTTNYCNPV